MNLIKNKYLKNKTTQDWEHYKKLRNEKTKIMRSSVQTYFLERCGGGPKSKDFWPTIKPFLSSKQSMKNSSEIILSNEKLLVSDQSEVCNILKH